jgi:hypothetical protein
MSTGNPQFGSQKNTRENILEKDIKLVENSTLDSISKLEFVLLLLDKKQGMQFGDFKVVESKEEEEKARDKFTPEIQEILRLVKETGLCSQMGKELSFSEGLIGFSVLIAKDKDVLEKFIQADKEEDDKTFGTILGYPPTAVQTYETDKKFDFHEELAPDELEKLKVEGIMPFLMFMPSKEHWLEELEWARENQRLIKEKAPQLFQELLLKE